MLQKSLTATGNAFTVPSSATANLSTKVKTATKTHRKARTIRSTDAILKSIANIDETERRVLTKQRIGQGYFRELLMNKYGRKCALCDITTKQLLVGSHIKAWSDCNNAEKLDENNGLLLCAHHDALFNKHLISFTDTRTLLVASTLTATEQTELNIGAIPSITVDPAMIPYLANHRSKLK